MRNEACRGAGSARLSIAVILMLALLVPVLAAKERRGATLVFTKKDGTVFRGELLAVKGESLILMDESTGQGVTEGFSEIRSVKIVKPPKVMKGMGTGFLIGGVAGAVLGGVITNPDNLTVFSSRGQAALFTGLVLGGACALIGGLLGAAAGVDEEIPLDRTDAVYLGGIAARLRRLARDRS